MEPWEDLLRTVMPDMGYKDAQVALFAQKIKANPMLAPELRQLSALYCVGTATGIVAIATGARGMAGPYSGLLIAVGVALAAVTVRGCYGHLTTEIRGGLEKAIQEVYPIVVQ